MISKIELLQQVLDLEPASRLFFPLAELLYAQGELAAAQAVLKQGILHHPDHLEAKFFLIQVCSELGLEHDAGEVFKPLAAVLGRYPSVLALWTKEHSPVSSDFTSALNTLSALLDAKGISWTELLSAGFQSSLGLEGKLKSAACAPVATGKAEPAPVFDVTKISQPAEDLKPLAAEPVRSKPTSRTSPAPIAAAAEVAALAKSLTEEPIRSATRVGKASGPSVVTKTMASLLVGQGDFKGALAIYEELYTQASDADSRDEFSRLILDTKAKLGECAPAQTPVAASPDSGKKKFLGMLEALAGRLEARG